MRSYSSQNLSLKYLSPESGKIVTNTAFVPASSLRATCKHHKFLHRAYESLHSGIYQFLACDLILPRISHSNTYHRSQAKSLQILLLSPHPACAQLASIISFFTVLTNLFIVGFTNF